MQSTSQSNTSTFHTSRIVKSLAYYLAFIALGISSASLGPTLPGLAAQTSSKISEISFLFTTRALGYLLGSLLGGRWYDRQAGHKVMSLALLGMAGMLACVPTLPWLWTLALILMVLGFGEGILDVGGNTLLVWVHGEKVATWMNGLHFFFGVGSFIAPLIIAQAILTTGGISVAYWVIAVLLLPIAGWSWLLPSPAHPPAVRSATGPQANKLMIFLIMIYFFMIVGAEGSFGGWIFTYARSQVLASEVQAAYLTSAFWGALTFGRLVSIPLAARLRPRTVLLIDLLGSIASVSLILIWPASYQVAWIGAIGMGFFVASAFPSMVTMAERLMPINGRVTGLFFTGASLGGMLFPWMIGQLFETHGSLWVMGVILIGLLAAVAVTARIISVQTRPKE